jgi:predicted MFS family arabinose efflux permease
VSFALAMILGPVFGGYVGVNNLFWIVAILPIISIYILVKYVPDAPSVTHTYHNVHKLEFLKNSEIHKMNITNMLQKGMMTFAFMIIPIVLTKTFGWDIQELWKVYMPAMIAGILAMGPAAMLAEKKGKFKTILLAGIGFFALSYIIIGMGTSQSLFIVGVIVFFIGFNMHEPIMQSLVTKYAKVHERGKVLGLFNSFGYFGTFIGGFVGGLYFKEVDGSFAASLQTISYAVVVISLAWFVMILTLPNPARKKNIYIDLSEVDQNKFNILDDTNGVDEWYINNTENIIIIKYDDSIINNDKIKSIIV